MAALQFILERYRFDIKRNIPQLYLPVILAGAVLRIAGFGVSPLWLDEAISLRYAQLPMLEMVRLISHDYTPPLWELLVKPFIWILGSNEVALRLPSVLASLVGLWLAWQIIREFIPEESHGARLAAVVLVSLTPYQFWLAQDGRVYALYTALYLAGVLFAIRGRWLGLMAVCGLLYYAHATSVVYVLTLLILAYYKHHDQWQSILIVAIVSTVAFSPWISVNVNNAQTGLLWSLPISIGSVAAAVEGAFFAAALNWGGFYYLAVAVIGLCLFVAMVLSLEPISYKQYHHKHLELAAVAAIPMISLITLSYFVTNILYFRVLAPSAPMMGIWFAAVLWPRRLTMTTWLIPYSWVILILAGLLTWSPATRGGDLRQVVQIIQAQSQPGDVVYHASDTSYLPFSLYLHNLPQYQLDEFDIGTPDAFKGPKVKLETIPHERAWIVWSRDPAMIWNEQRMLSYTRGATLVGIINYYQAPNIEIYLKEDK